MSKPASFMTEKSEILPKRSYMIIIKIFIIKVDLINIMI